MATNYPNKGILFRVNKNLHSAIIALGLTLLAYSSQQAQAQQSIPAYTATYKAKYKGFNVKAKRELKHLKNGDIQVSQSLSHFLIKINEQSQVSPIAAAQIKPKHYHYTRKGVGKNKSTVIDFDQNTNTLKETSNKKVFSRSELPPSAQDKLSYQLQLRLDAMHYGDKFDTRHYPYIENGRAKQYSFRKLKDETLKTALGNLETAVFERVRPKGSNRSTKIWLAKSWGYLIARIEQQENGDSKYALELERATIGKQSLNAFNSTYEDEEEGDFGFGID